MSRTFLTTEQLAKRWHTTVPAIKMRRARGNLPGAIQSGKRLLWDEADIEQYEDEQKAAS